jgi:hypothetical protein
LIQNGINPNLVNNQFSGMAVIINPNLDPHRNRRNHKFQGFPGLHIGNPNSIPRADKLPGDDHIRETGIEKSRIDPLGETGL